MPVMRFAGSLVLAAALWALPVTAGQWKGINLAGAEFTPQTLPGEYGKDYIYPDSATIAQYAQAGFDTLRVPFLWERMQLRLGGLLNPKELARLDGVVMGAKRHNLNVILDVHNYGSYRGVMIGAKPVTLDSFTHFWKLLATHYQQQPNVVFGLMNEPKEHTADVWRKIAQAAITAIRATGAKQTILVPGTIYTGAHSWNKKAGKLSNAEALVSLNDPAHKLLIEVHHYFDSNYSGTKEDCSTPQATDEALQPVTDWLKANHMQGVLAEFGANGSEPCLAALEAALSHMKRNEAQWKGWAYWAAGVWFGNYPFNVYPADAATHPQLPLLQRYMK